MIKKIAKRWTTTIIKNLGNELTISTGKHKFLRLIDQKKKELYIAISAVYGKGAFSKLLALKVINLLVARYHFINKHSIVSSRPIELMIDPSNACQLHCPGCIHTSNKGWIEECKRHWPAGMLSNVNYRKLIRSYAPFSFATYLYNYGEPFLNKNVYEYIQLAVNYVSYVTVSSNLSIPILDAERLVHSGLNMLIMSIDGLTQTTYEKYRRGGDLKMVLENVVNVIEAKKKLRSNYPYLIWQYLTFEHNIHEIELALEKARQMGVDAFHVLTPFDVSPDDPSMRIVQTGHEGYTYFSDPILKFSSLTENQNHLVDESEFLEQWEESWFERMERLGGMNEINAGDANICGWLYKNITMDALGRILPCCMPPADARRLIYGNISDNRDWFNLPDVLLSRMRGSRLSIGLFNKAEQPPYCIECPLAIEPPHDLWRIQQDLPSIDNRGVLDQQSIKVLTDWIIS